MNKSFLIPVIALALSGCGIFGGGKEAEVVFDENVGPDTRALVNSLPKGLIGDKENALHTQDNLRAEDDTGAGTPRR